MTDVFIDYWDISLNFCKISDKFMKSHHILKKKIESRYAKFLLHILVTQLMSCMRISLSYGTRSNDWIFYAIITWRKRYLFVTTILLLFSISTDAFCSHRQTFHIPCYTRRFKDYRILQCARSLNLMRAIQLSAKSTSAMGDP